MERLNFNHFFYFYIVAKEGSVKAAAERLFVSQPTISDQIKLLEEYFNCKLFLREHRSLTLTREGEIALDYAEKIFDQSKELTSLLRNEADGPKKTLDIGLTQLMSMYFLFDSILPFFNESEMAVNVREDQRHLLLADLEEGHLDIVFSDNKSSLSSTMNAYRIGVNRTFAVANKKYRKFKKGFPESLQEIPFYNYNYESSLRYEIELFFAKVGITPSIIGEANDMDLFELITREGLAFTIVPEIAKNRLCRDKDIIVLGELNDLQTSVWAIVKSSNKDLAKRLIERI